jgi:hypothetical protein
VTASFSFPPIEMHLRTTTGLNAREHWRARSRRVAFEKDVTREWLNRRRAPPSGRKLLVTLTRVSPASKLPDDDNVVAGLKAVRDAVGEWLGCGDAPDAPVSWRYRAERGEWAVRITVEEVP